MHDEVLLYRRKPRDMDEIGRVTHAERERERRIDLLASMSSVLNNTESTQYTIYRSVHVVIVHLCFVLAITEWMVSVASERPFRVGLCPSHYTWTPHRPVRRVV